VLNVNWILPLSVIFMVPIYTYEFIIVYGLKVPKIKDMQFFQKYKDNFVITMERPILELTLYYLNLTLFFMCIGSLYYMNLSKK